MVFELTEAGCLLAEEWLATQGLPEGYLDNADMFAILLTANVRINTLIRENAPVWAKCIIFTEGEGFYYDELPENVPLHGSMRWKESGIKIPQKDELCVKL